MELNAETFDRPRHTEITIACCEHLGTQHAVIHGELFAHHFLVSVGSAVELQQPRSYIHVLEVFCKDFQIPRNVVHDSARTSTCGVLCRETLPTHIKFLSKTAYSASSEELYGLGTSVSIAKPATLVGAPCPQSLCSGNDVGAATMRVVSFVLLPPRTPP